MDLLVISRLLFVTGTGKLFFRWFLLFGMGFFLHLRPAYNQTFIKVNTGTKSEIRKIMVTGDGGVFFLTNKLYALEGDRWEKVDIPVLGPLATFNALSKSDIWYSATQETSTSLLFHYHNGITENVSSPLANVITSVFFISPNMGFFASYSDVVVFHNGVFTKINPFVTRGYITRIFGFDANKLWFLNQYYQMFAYESGNYTEMFPGKVVKDFKFITRERGFILCDKEILEVSGSRIIRQIKSPLLESAERIYLRNDHELWIIGDGGLIMTLEDGILHQKNYDGKENLKSLAFGEENDIWISGENGLLLYSGNKQFPVYNERYPGFSAQKLIPYGIDVDNGYGVAFADFDGDDKTDIYSVCISDPDRLFINHMDSIPGKPIDHSFIEEAAKRGAWGLYTGTTPLILSELKLGVAVGDVDNDGDEDIYLTSLTGKNKLLLNNGKGYFRNVTEQPGRACEDMNRSNAAAFADIDLDGDLDLFVTSEHGSNRLFINDGNGYFTDVTQSAHVASSSGGMCASFSDINHDGYPDLCVTFWYPSNKVYLNETRNGKVRFRNITAETDISKAEPAKSNAVVFADINNDGHPDLFIANRHSANKLYLNNGKGIYRDVTSRFFKNKVFMSNGAVFADFDLDGYQDLYITNVGENVMYRNMGGAGFKDVTGDFGAELSGYCTGCAVGDVDNDGDVDFYAANYINGTSLLFINKIEKKNAVTFNLEGTRSNRNAIGATIFLYEDNPSGIGDSLVGFREISGGGGYGSVSAKEAIFALKSGRLYYAVVKFPASGVNKKINNITAGSVIRVEEETGFAAYKTLSQKAIVRFFTDRDIQLEIVKYIAVILILMIYLRFQSKGVIRIYIMRWMMCLSIFIVFALVNHVFLFSSSIILFFTPPALAITLLIMLHLITERVLLKRMARREKMELREKISRDLHDDLASTLGSISIYSSTLHGMNNEAQPNSRNLSAKISELTQTALQSITDIIWMTAPRNDSLGSLLSKLNNLIFDVLTDNGIKFDEKVDIPEQTIILHEKLRQDAFLIMKEAVNNIIRHSRARHVTLRSWTEENLCFIQLTDDGRGVDVNEPKSMVSHGNGLINMRQRASESGISLQVKSSPGSGCRIEISFRI